MTDELDIPCIHCGYCCKQCSCGFGEYDPVKKQCKSLIKISGDYYCGDYLSIIKDPTSIVSPAFGEGCCSNLNTDRREKILQIRGRS